MFRRYAVFVTPRPGPLAAFGASWLGWDIASGRSVPHPDVEGVDVALTTEAPRKYGFHGTIKPPFRLSDDATVDALQVRLAALCATKKAVTLDGLALGKMGGFLALLPVGDVELLTRLASAVVQDLDIFRAPPSEAELAQRRRNGLTSAQESNLQNWGYPFVLDCFRFHMTLTGRLKRSQISPVKIALSNLVVPVLPVPFTIDSLTLCGEAEDGYFHEVCRYPLSR